MIGPFGAFYPGYAGEGKSSMEEAAWLAIQEILEGVGYSLEEIDMVSKKLVEIESRWLFRDGE